jgi:hypothetical protein
MALEFARKLQEIVAIARRDSRASLSFGLGVIADVLLESLDTVDSDFPSIDIGGRSVARGIEIARSAAELLDACSVIEAHLFSAPAERCFLEFPLPQNRSHDSLVTFLDEAAGRIASDTTFVYAVWSLQPERCLLVARSQECNARSFGPSARGQLLPALQQGSLLAVMLPSPMTAATALDVEAALLAVLSRQTLPPAVRSTYKPVPAARGAAYLAEISRLLQDVASRFRSSVPSEVSG